MRRICVFGASASGKTTLGRWLGEHLRLPFTDLDDVHWRPGWTESPTEVFRAAIAEITQRPRWVRAGNYAKARDPVWPRADTLVWLDLPLTRVLWRSTRRALREWRTAAPICNGNRQSLAMIVNGRAALLGHTRRTYHARRREWPQALALPEQAQARVVHLRSDAEIARWRAAVQAGNTPLDR
jgi:adenylate kinase family enzyme